MLRLGKLVESGPGREEVGRMVSVPETLTDGLFEICASGGGESIDFLPPLDDGVGVLCCELVRRSFVLTSTEGELDVDALERRICASLAFVLGAASRDDVLEPAIAVAAMVWRFRWEEYCWLRERGGGRRASSGMKPAMVVLLNCMRMSWVRWVGIRGCVCG